MDVKYTSFNLDKSGNQEELILNKVLSNQNLENKENKVSLDKSQVMVYYYVNKNGYAQQMSNTVDGHEEHRENDADNVSLDLGSTCSKTSLIKIVDGQPMINTTSMVNDSYVDLKAENIKYVNFMIWAFFWCFPFTGIPALIYSHLMRKYYRLHDMQKAKKYLEKAERLILVTFVIGFTLVALLFAILQAYVFNVHVSPIVNSTHTSRKHYPFIYH
jgi:hypothetical protein